MAIAHTRKLLENYTLNNNLQDNSSIGKFGKICLLETVTINTQQIHQLRVVEVYLQDGKRINKFEHNQQITNTSLSHFYQFMAGGK
jgi:hypothetical protein